MIAFKSQSLARLLALPCFAALCAAPPAPIAQSPSTPEAAKPAPAAFPADAIIARVNGEPILLSQLKEAAFDQDVPLQALSQSGLRGEGYRRAITQIIDETLLVQQANALEIKVEELDVARQIELMLKSLGQQFDTPAQLDAYLASRKLNLASLRELLTQRERRRNLVAQLISRRVTISGDEVDAFVREQEAAGGATEELSLSQILIADPAAPAGETDSKSYRKALDLARKAGAAPAEFGNLARTSSDEPASRERGGWMGWLDPQALEPALRDAVRKLKPGGISAPVASPEGWHIFHLEARRTPRDLLYARRYMQARTELIEELRRDAAIKFFDLQGTPLDREAEKALFAD